LSGTKPSPLSAVPDDKPVVTVPSGTAFWPGSAEEITSLEVETALLVLSENWKTIRTLPHRWSVADDFLPHPVQNSQHDLPGIELLAEARRRTVTNAGAALVAEVDAVAFQYQAQFLAKRVVYLDRFVTHGYPFAPSAAATGRTLLDRHFGHDRSVMTPFGS
jgi:hypothetical protein